MPRGKTTELWCVSCGKNVRAKMVRGSKVYPHRPDLKHLPFWECPNCLNTVGTHYKSSDPLKPLGVIATKEMKAIRMDIHHLIDPIWKNQIMTRTQVYKFISARLGHEYHTGELRTVGEARKVLMIVGQLRKGLEKDGFEIREKEHSPRFKLEN